jgi:hypothetical protein
MHKLHLKNIFVGASFLASSFIPEESDVEEVPLLRRVDFFCGGSWSRHVY